MVCKMCKGTELLERAAPLHRECTLCLGTGLHPTHDEPAQEPKRESAQSVTLANKPTAGAMRAATAVLEKLDYPAEPLNLRIAPIIDQETGLPELLEALKAMLKTHRMDSGVASVRGGWVEARRKAVAAIAKVEGDPT